MTVGLDRRLIGTGLLVVALIVASLVPALQGRRVSGEPRAGDVPHPATIGACLRNLDGQGPVPSGTRLGMDADVRTVDCSEPHDGEIIAVTSESSYLRDRTVNPAVADLNECFEIADRYVGIAHSMRRGDRSPLLGSWDPPSSPGLAFLGPSNLHARAGADWLACVLLPPDRVTGSVAGLYAGAARRNPFAVCHPDDGVRLGLAVSCRKPHPTEILGWRAADQNSDRQAELDESCRELAARMTGMTDPTAAGALHIRAIVVHLDANGLVQRGFPPVPWDGTGLAFCTLGAEPPRLLIGTLTGLGDAPVPFVR
jgi:hypothetical protein